MVLIIFIYVRCLIKIGTRAKKPKVTPSMSTSHSTHTTSTPPVLASATWTPSTLSPCSTPLASLHITLISLIEDDNISGSIC